MSGSHVVVEGPEEVFRRVSASVGATPGFADGAAARCGVVMRVEDAREAVLAAVGGARVIVHARADRDVIDQLVDDLGRLGSVEHVVGDLAPDPLSVQERELLALLAGGSSLGEAARRLSISRRTADRRLRSARDALGVQTTAEAVVAFVASSQRS